MGRRNQKPRLLSLRNSGLLCSESAVRVPGAIERQVHGVHEGNGFEKVEIQVENVDLPEMFYLDVESEGEYFRLLHHAVSRRLCRYINGCGF